MRGDLIDDRYRLLSVAGTGGMATVWRARDERAGRIVAIKLMTDALASNPVAVRRFEREARTHARIQHPNLVHVYDCSVAPPRPYLVTEYVDGSTLSERLDRGGLSPAAIQTLAEQLLSAIACVHEHGVLHRDIKPANVLIDADGRALLTDFGLARLEGPASAPRSGEVMGTLRFLAPELVEGHPPTKQSDLFAFGVLLRTVCSGQRPPPIIRELIDWLTRADPGERPDDAQCALQRLDPAHVHEGSSECGTNRYSASNPASAAAKRRHSRHGAQASFLGPASPQRPLSGSDARPLVLSRGDLSTHAGGIDAEPRQRQRRS